jgi:hypothetical protein
VVAAAAPALPTLASTGLSDSQFAAACAISYAAGPTVGSSCASLTDGTVYYVRLTQAVANSRLSPSGGGASFTAASSSADPLHAEKAKTAARGSKKNMKTDADVDFRALVHALFGFPSGGPHAVS